MISSDHFQEEQKPPADNQTNDDEEEEESQSPRQSSQEAKANKRIIINEEKRLARLINSIDQVSTLAVDLHSDTRRGHSRRSTWRVHHQLSTPSHGKPRLSRPFRRSELRTIILLPPATTREAAQKDSVRERRSGEDDRLCRHHL